MRLGLYRPCRACTVITFSRNLHSVGWTDMNIDLGLLLLTAASIGFIHTLLGPDHYLPFVAMWRGPPLDHAPDAVDHQPVRGGPRAGVGRDRLRRHRHRRVAARASSGSKACAATRPRGC